jgi:hypothetical protein
LLKELKNVLALKKKDQKTDTRDWEEEINQITYRLYYPTPDEVKIIEGK